MSNQEQPEYITDATPTDDDAPRTEQCYIDKLTRAKATISEAKSELCTLSKEYLDFSPSPEQIENLRCLLNDTRKCLVEGVEMIIALIGKLGGDDSAGYGAESDDGSGEGDDDNGDRSDDSCGTVFNN